MVGHVFSKPEKNDPPPASGGESDLLFFMLNQISDNQSKMIDAVNELKATVGIQNTKIIFLEEAHKKSDATLAELNRCVQKNISNNKAFVKFGGGIVTAATALLAFIGWTTGILDIKDLPKIKAAIEMYRQIDNGNSDILDDLKEINKKEGDNHETQ
jgi:hypothetical protein